MNVEHEADRTLEATQITQANEAMVAQNIEPLPIPPHTDETDAWYRDAAGQRLPEITEVIGLHISMPAIAARHRYLLVIQEHAGRMLTIRDDATVILGEGVTLDEASRAFWARVEIEGKTLIARAEAAERRVAELEGRQ